MLTISECSKNDDEVAAGSWLMRMVNNGVRPDVASYSAVIHACAKAGCSSQSWLEKIRKQASKPIS